MGKLIPDAIIPPDGYALKEDGVWQGQPPNAKGESQPPLQLTHKPVWVEARSRDGDRENWGLFVHWRDHDDNLRSQAVPMRMIHATGNELAKALADNGLSIVPGRERKLLAYLAAFTPERRLVAATATGWVGDAYILPTEVINEPDDRRHVYQPLGYSPAEQAAKRSGDFGAWKDGIATAPTEGRFAIQAALSAALSYPLGVEAGGFHVYGTTSHGKTTVLQCAASVWGDGSDPSIAGRPVCIQRWNATGNGLEGMAAGFNDLPLIVDEIGENDGKEFGRTIYRIMSGTGKSRARVDGSLARNRTWRVLVLSAGEASVDDYINDSGQRTHGGQLVRLVDIPVDSMFNDKVAADAMKEHCGSHYGHAGPNFLKAADVGNLRARWRKFDVEQLGAAPTHQSGRVRTRFALVAFVGAEAARLGILPWSESEAIAACQELYERWLRAGTGVSEGERGIAHVREFLMRYGNSRFERDPELRETRDGDQYESYKREPIDRAGWYRDDRYCFVPEVFREACGGADPKGVKKALEKRGWLSVSGTNRLTATIKVDGETVRVVAVKSDILGGNEPDPAGTNSDSDRSSVDGATGAPGAQPATTGPSTGTTGEIDRCPPVPGAEAGTTGHHRESVPVPTETRMNSGSAPGAPQAPPRDDILDSTQSGSDDVRPYPVRNNSSPDNEMDAADPSSQTRSCGWSTRL